MADEPTNSVDMLYPDEHPRSWDAMQDRAVGLARRTNARMQLDDARPRAPLDATQRKAYECLRGGLEMAYRSAFYGINDSPDPPRPTYGPTKPVGIAFGGPDCGDWRRHIEYLSAAMPDAREPETEEKTEMASYSASPAAGSFVDAKALGNQEHLVTIAAVEQRTFEETNRDGTRYMNTKIVLAFEHRNKKWIMPKICSAMMANTFGDEMDNWPSRQIILYVDPNIQFGNKIVAGVRWKLPAAAQQPAQTGAQQQSAPAIPGDGAMQQPVSPPPDPGATPPAGMQPAAPPPPASADDYGSAWDDDEIPFSWVAIAIPLGSAIMLMLNGGGIA